MSSIEERLVRDIEEVTRGVIVTDSDLFEARTAVAERIDSRRSRARLRVPAAAAAVLVILAGITLYVGLGGEDTAARPAGPGPAVDDDPDAAYLTGVAPTAQLLRGVWRVDNTGILLRFGADGTVQFDRKGTLFSDPTTTGTYVIDGDRITVATTRAKQPACVGTRFSIRASVPSTGALRFTRPVTDAAGCTPLGVAQGALEQVLPTGPAMADFTFSQRPGFRSLSDTTLLHGFWQAEGGGHVLEMLPGGAYSVADASGDPVDRGTWSFAGSALTLKSSAESTACRSGDVFVLGALQYGEDGTSAVRGRVTKNDCEAAWTPAAWFLIPQDGN